MSIWIRLECEEDWVWLRNTFARLYGQMQDNPSPYVEYIETFQRIDAALHGATTEAPEAPQIEYTALPKKRARKERKKKEPQYHPNLCSEHPDYAGVRAPRKDCSTCWDVYERLQHGGAASPQRRKFYRERM